MMAISFLLGAYLLITGGKGKGLKEEDLLLIILVVIVFAIIGARAIYVLTNLGDFTNAPLKAVRIDHGGLAFHGGLLGGILSGWIAARFKNYNIDIILDLAIPGIAIGYSLVRFANIFNQEILGRPSIMLSLERHPTQVYGIVIGLAVLFIHIYLVKRKKYIPGTLFWSFVFYYSLLRGTIEETFRENPLYALGYINEFWGAGFFTLTHLITPLLLLLSWWMINRKKEIWRWDYRSNFWE